jgi:hypothetical protein
MLPPEPPVTRIRFVSTGDMAAKPKKRPTYAEIGLRADMSQFYGMKAVLEELFGHPVYLRLKETAIMKEWRAETVRLLSAVAYAINSTVAIADQEWRQDISDIIRRGQERIRGSDTISDLFSELCATLTRIVFMQIGMMPSRTAHMKTVPLTSQFWTFRAHRSVQYVQTATQRETLDQSRLRQARSE